MKKPLRFYYGKTTFNLIASSPVFLMAREMFTTLTTVNFNIRVVWVEDSPRQSQTNDPSKVSLLECFYSLPQVYEGPENFAHFVE